MPQPEVRPLINKTDKAFAASSDLNLAPRWHHSARQQIVGRVGCAHVAPPQSGSHADVTGRTILHYEIKEPLGEGGMGVVYKALDRKLNRLVALKFLPRDLVASPEANERFIQEATALSLLNHPHIATLFDFEEADGDRFLVLEYLAGGTLKDRVEALSREGRQLPIEEVLDYARQTAEGLVHAHRRGIIH